MNDEIIEVAINDIQIGRRFRKDHGDVEALARQIERGELLQPIGVTEDLRLVFGERRLRAYRDVLKRDTIPARIVDPKSVELAQIDENSGRKDYTISEKVEIVEFLRGFKYGGDRRSDQARNREPDRLTLDQAAKLVGLGGKDGYFRAKAVVQKGVPELVKALDDEEISISAAAELASLNPEEQRSLLTKRKDWTAAEIIRIKQKVQNGGGSIPANPPLDASDELKVDAEDDPGVRPGFLPVNHRDVDQPVVVPSGPDAERLDHAADKVAPPLAEMGGSDGYSFYPTPRYVTEALVEVEEFGSLVWEPACGDGAISKVLIEEGYEVISSDIVDRGYGEVEDFFQSDRTAESVVTNPDYDYSEEFVVMALAKTTHKVAMLLPLTFLSSGGRYDLFRTTPLKCVYVFTSRVSLYPKEVRTSGGNGRETYAWFVWQHGYEGEPVIRFFPPDVGGKRTRTGERPMPKHPARQDN